MTLQELRQAVTEATTPTEELIINVLNFMFNFDPYGFLDCYGYPADGSLYDEESARNEAIFMLTEERQELLDRIDFMIQEETT